jgi:hypothetical protein
MDNVKEALAILQETVVFERDKEIQDEIKKAINRLREETVKREQEETDEEETNICSICAYKDWDEEYDICYTCAHMCDVRRKYYGGTMLKCADYKKGEALKDEFERC